MNKQALAMSFVVKVIIALVIMFVVLYIFNSFATPLNSITNQCSALNSNNWYIKDSCNSDVAFENKLVAREKYEDELYVCCSPLPGKTGAFKELYAKDYENHSLNVADREKTVKKKSSSTTAGSGTQQSDFKRVAAQNTKIHFYINGAPIAQKLDSFYSEALPANVVLQPNSKNYFVVKHNYTAGQKCVMQMAPAYIDKADNDRILILKTVNPDYKFKVETPCESPMTFPLKELKTLDGTNYLKPGFYKWDFEVYEHDINKRSDSASTYVQVEATEGVSGDSSGSQITFIDIKPLRVETRDNIRTCYFVPYVNKTKLFPTIALYERSDSVNVPLSYSNTATEQTSIALRSSAVSPGFSRVHFYFEEDGATFTNSFSYADCDVVNLQSFISYTQNGFDALSGAACSTYSTFTGTDCKEPYQRPSIYDKHLTNCVWDGFITGCLSCDVISSCNQYDKKVACNSNQCLGEDNMNQRCFWNTKGPNDCRQCNYALPTTSVCGQYLKQADCTTDACHLFTHNDVLCTWQNNACVSV